MISDKDFFQKINLDYLGLKKVREALAVDDCSRAKTEFVNYMQTRNGPLYFPLDIHADANVIREADLVMDHTFAPCYTYPPTTIGKEIEWNEDPVGDEQWAIALNRHHHWCVLGKAYARTGNEKYAGEFVAQLLSWAQKMPVKIPGRNNYIDGFSDDATLHFNAGIRAGLTWIPAYYYFQNSPSFRTDAKITMFKLLWEHADYLSYPKHFYVAHNHGIMETNGFMAIAIMFPEFKKSSSWQKLGWQRFDEMMDRQVYPDGFLKELTTHYHCVSLVDVGITSILLAKVNGITIPQKYVNQLERMYECLMYFVKPDGTAPMTNDSDVGPGREALKRGVEIFDRPDFSYVYSEGKKGTEPEKKSIGFPYAGIYIMRSSWDPMAKYLSFVCGPQGTCHVHRDNLNIDLHAYGRSLIVDPGRYKYSDDKFANFLRFSSKAHNTVIVDDSEQNWWEDEAEKPLKDNWINTAGFDYVEGIHTTGYETVPDVIHQRNILFIKDEYWVVWDIMTGSGIHCLDQFWHFTPCRVEIDDKKKIVRTIQPNTGNIIIAPADADKLSLKIAEGQDDPVQGWYSPEYGFKEPSPAAIYTQSETELPANMATVLYPYPAGHKPEISVSRMSVLENEKPLSSARASGLEIKVNEKRKDYILASHQTPSRKRCGQFTFDGQLTYISQNAADNLLRILAKDASSLRDNNKEIFISDIVLSDVEILYADKILKVYASHIGNLKVYAPATDKVLFNGREKKFTREGDFITLVST
ncbi:MAG: heparinase II/III family protein [Phycisphaerae bacterium]|nr:heparinase II/III family protein [Phycisphaerae bacterium]